MGLFGSGKRKAAYPEQEAAEQSGKGFFARPGRRKFWTRTSVLNDAPTLHTAVGDSAATLRRRTVADPESDTAEELLIEREREGAEDPRREGGLG
ncbi:MAG TPA: hypothetical protein VMV53_01895 [Acidimicrobiales bacterium]|nr:hypothetical protein [Acidimicrobiales bacterium]